MLLNAFLPAETINRMRFHIVDVFAERRYAGNQLAVIESLGELSDAEMQQVAQEMNYAETTFIESFDARDGGYDVRIFTPNEEIPFAGHPTLGIAAVLRDHEGTETDAEKIVLNLGVGQIPVETASKTLWMRQNPPEFGDQLDSETFARVLSLSEDDLLKSISEDAIDGELPVQIVSTGLPTVIVPLADRDALERAEIDRSVYDNALEDRDAKNVLVFCRDPRYAKNDLAVRVFAPYYGVPEDPATGSSNGCLAGYLARYGDSVALRVEQGYEMGRPSLLHLRADGEGTVEVGGRVVPVARGELL